METKISIRLNIFDTEDFSGSSLSENILGSLLSENFLGSLLRENLLESLLDLKIKYMRRLLEDFASDRKPKFY